MKVSRFSPFDKRRIRGTDNAATPDELYRQLDEEFHFTFDPCPLNPRGLGSLMD